LREGRSLGAPEAAKKGGGRVTPGKYKDRDNSDVNWVERQHENAAAEIPNDAINLLLLGIAHEEPKVGLVEGGEPRRAQAYDINESDDTERGGKILHD